MILRNSIKMLYHVKNKINITYTLLKTTMVSLKLEGVESKEALKLLLKKYKNKDKLTEEETRFIMQQAKDIGKLSLLILFVVLPGSPITIPILYKVSKKLNIDLTPSAFKKLETKELIEDTEKTLKSKEVELNSLEKELEILKLEKNEILDKSNLSEMYNRKF